jgi:hypothetical protein
MPDPQANDETSWTDEIVAEVRRAREQLLAASDFDLKQEASGRAPVTFHRRAPAKEASA